MSQERQVTVRVQKVKRNRIRMKLFLFAALAAALLLITIFAKDICPYDPYAQDLSQAMQPPSATHLMGTDTYGRDMLSRVLIGAQTSISSTFALVAIITVFGTIVGIFCGYYGGAVDSVMMRISDICLAFPGLVFAMAVAAILKWWCAECSHCAGTDQLAEVFQNCQKPDPVHEEPAVHAGLAAGR